MAASHHSKYSLVDPLKDYRLFDAAKAYAGARYITVINCSKPPDGLLNLLLELVQWVRNGFAHSTVVYLLLLDQPSRKVPLSPSYLRRSTTGSRRLLHRLSTLCRSDYSAPVCLLYSEQLLEYNGWTPNRHQQPLGNLCLRVSGD